MSIRLDSFTAGYVEALIGQVQNEHDDDNNTPYKGKTENDISPDAWIEIHKDCTEFQEKHADRIIGANNAAGIDFWLTRNRDGAGFWDGDWNEPDASIMTEYSHKCGEISPYVGDDGLIYLF